MTVLFTLKKAVWTIYVKYGLKT